ncbi:GntR family transcriptional regulator [Novosphingobium album (ex Hu et al. 2023)]|uniref:GntR family transcriptional regulator n=1 Tax=Novosphingobium album (ex Hu et al. 2023) TaxID=2930093 RepID=A0ABT0B807_9SPHN|nr:GntR family transcriptional regulator [Novosphingobium album (ex Hu et al. 2023)]MCJ2181006.1 GntR family transcriptional regulator [Novosphingobium album (ex Hu et al. 2023)]
MTALQPGDSGGQPLYLGIASALKDAIFSGRYPVGSYLPTEDQLAKDHGVSRNTIRESLRKLREEKLIISRRGSGTRVLPPQSSDSNFLHAVSINDFQSYALSWDFQIKIVELRKMPKAFASWVGTSPNEEWLAIHGVSRTHGARHPECWIELYVHRDYASISRLVTSHPGPVFKLIEDMFGQMIVEMTQEISAELVTKPLAKVLEVEPGTPAVVVRRAFKTAEGKVIEAAHEIYPASRFRYQVNLHRAGSKHL